MSQSLQQLVRLHSLYLFILFKEPHIGGPGRCGTDLMEDNLSLLQCFFPRDITPEVNTDTIGFFIAKFVKKKDENKK